MTKVAERLDARSYRLRSGAANGADAAFEKGSLNREIFLPWPGFNGSASPFTGPSGVALTVARVLHPAFDRLSEPAKQLMARNSHQILGPDMDAPSDFVVCWTPDGAETADQRTHLTGGTGQAIALASRWGVPVFNLARPDALVRISHHLSGHLPTTAP